MKPLLFLVFILSFISSPAFSKEGAISPIINIEETSETQVADTSQIPASLPAQYIEIDVGIPFLFAPANSFRHAYSKADLSVGGRLAASYTLNRFRFELGVLYQELADGTPDISTHNNQAVSHSSSDATVWQTETLFFWLKNEKNRVAFIGGGPVSIRLKEEFSVHYVNSTPSQTFIDTTTAQGYKLVVGGKDNDNHLKTTFSYTTAIADSTYGKKFNLGGYALTFHLSFGAL